MPKDLGPAAKALKWIIFGGFKAKKREKYVNYLFLVILVRKFEKLALIVAFSAGFSCDFARLVPP